jgi:predicted AlkP superfamily phosphohydrolase/phosphomutase
MTDSAAWPRVLIIGLDGATFDNVRPWTEQGRLPTFKRLLDGGVHGPLRSTFPPVTAPAWTSFMTGKNPGKHGLYHFIEPQPNSYDLRYTNARSRMAPTVWRMLSDAGMKVGALNIPMTYPPEPVNGYMVSGMDAPEDSTAITHPPELFAELAARFDKVSKQIRYLGYLNSDDRRDAVLAGLAEMDEHYEKLATYLFEKHPVDVAMLVFTSTDTVQHFFYQYFDATHPQHDARGAEKYRDAILKVYERLDGVIARLIERQPKDGVVMLMSDHGFQSTSGRVVHLNHFLEDAGVLRRKKAGLLRRISRPVIKRLDGFLRTSLTPQHKAKIAELLPAMRRKWESQYAGFADIDWANTKAYCYEVLTFPPGIWINTRGQRPHGVVEPGPEYDALLADLTAKLLALQDPVTKKPLVSRVYRKEEAYHGPYLEHAPDLTVSWWEGVTFLTKPSFGEGAVVEYFGGQPLEAGDWGGGHALDGIVALHGTPFQKGVRLEGAAIVDVAPTLLHLLGLPVPQDMDGHVLQDAFTPEFVAAHPITTSADAGGASGSGQGGATYSDDESDKVAERLRGLGYIG